MYRYKISGGGFLVEIGVTQVALVMLLMEGIRSMFLVLMIRKQHISKMMKENMMKMT